MGLRESIDARRGVPLEHASQGHFQRAFALEPGDDMWAWLESPVGDSTEGETRFEGVEGLSDALLRISRRAAR